MYTVSIIITAYNYDKYIERALRSCLDQSLPRSQYEVIVVNDVSTDDTAGVLKELQQQYDNLWDVTITPDEKRELKGKKHALSCGVAAAKYDWLVLIDADCKPASEHWLELADWRCSSTPSAPSSVRARCWHFRTDWRGSR